MKNNCVVILGPTASGKTKLACQLAFHLNGEIISADSRQVYRHLNIGTGKDLEEYFLNGKQIPYHLIDICDPGQQFYLHDFETHCEKAFKDVSGRNKLPIICGGTGLYLDALRKDFSLTQVKENAELRAKLELLTKEELLKQLKEFPKEYIQHIDLNSKKRIIRGIEVSLFLKDNPKPPATEKKPYNPFYIGIDVSIDERKRRISQRLKYRLENGLIEEVQGLLKMGINHERLEFLGLEYKFVSHYLQDKINKTELFEQLQTAIFQFAKRQMTWFRKMEKEGVKINWVHADYQIEELAKLIRS